MKWANSRECGELLHGEMSSLKLKVGDSKAIYGQQFCVEAIYGA